jgi:hypothetical protein
MVEELRPIARSAAMSGMTSETRALCRKATAWATAPVPRRKLATTGTSTATWIPVSKVGVDRRATAYSLLAGRSKMDRST